MQCPRQYYSLDLHTPTISADVVTSLPQRQGLLAFWRHSEPVVSAFRLLPSRFVLSAVLNPAGTVAIPAPVEIDREFIEGANLSYLAFT